MPLYFWDFLRSLVSWILCFGVLCSLIACGKGLTLLGGFSGSLDPNFGDRGILIFSSKEGSDYLASLAVDQFGSLFAIGNYIEGGSYYPHVRKFTSAGVLDPSFTPVDKTTLSAVISGASYPVRVIPLTSGKVLVGGICVGCTSQGGAPFVIRLTAAGTLDTTFGVGGIRVVEIPGFTYGEGSDLQIGHPELGPIWLAGSVSNGAGTADWMVARFDFEGNFDTSFATTGYQTYALSSGDDLAPLLALKADGGAYIGGTSYPAAAPNDESGDFALISIQPDGTQDMSFGVSGLATFASSDARTDSAFGLHLTEAGILQTGKCKSSTFDKFCLVRWTAEGAMDASFGENGLLLKDYGHDPAFGGTAVDLAGRILAAGSFPTPGGSLMAVTRFHPNGELDTSFGVAGIASRSGDQFGTPAAIAVDSVGRVYAGGYFFTSSLTLDSMILRFLP